ncbi:hypothetical protein F53441_7159 [Fusarium austroafricanum]|uniref:Uncharacterized protein n=1 Tax=Fusarium austroafricanum TaxID=2364996 RepID=A0A8H4KFS4_9HYPO|nr:hypothetical protein F53441_7159 [Fusarium austroafricanum]
MALPPGVPEVGPEGYFVLSTNLILPGENHLRNPICVEASLCRLCRFPINREKEKIVTLTPDNHVSSAFVIYYEKYYAPLYIDKSLNMSFRNCVYPYCTHNRGLAIAFHAECASIADRFGTPLYEYRSITEQSYRHVSLDHTRRRDLVRNLIEDSLRRAYGKLSPELWRIVSDDDELIKLYTIAQISLHHRKTEWSIDPSVLISGTCINVDGVEYVDSLSNSPNAGSRQAWEATSSAADKALYISSDHLGIRQVITDPDGAKLDEVYPVYWQTISKDNKTLTFSSDGLKLRRALNPSIYPRVLWPHPMKPSELDTMAFYYAGWGEGELEARMRTLTFNEHGTTGYSLCWAGDEMVSIHVHHHNQEPDTSDSSWVEERSEYESRKHLKWTHYPIERGEFIHQVWLRGSNKYDTTKPLPSQGEGGLPYHLSTPWGLQTYKRPSDIALGFVTSKGRTILAGSFPGHHEQPTPYWKHRQWHLISHTLTNSPLRIFFSPSPHGIPLIAAPKLPETEHGFSAPTQTPLGSMPRFNPLRTLHYSSASLENITQVYVSRSKVEKDIGVIRQFDFENSCMKETTYKKATGLLFRYDNGSEATVGCFRFDWCEPLLETKGSRGLFIGTKPGKIMQIPPHVAVVDVTPSEIEDEWTWIELPWTGTLEWWFNPDSLDTSIAHVP